MQIDRELIIEEIKNLYKTSKEKCDKILDDAGFYEYIENYYRSPRNWLKFGERSDEDPFESIPLCWQGPFSYGGSTTWVMIGEFVVEEDTLFAGIYNYHSGPPDYMFISLEVIPDNVLSNALDTIKKGFSTNN